MSSSDQDPGPIFTTTHEQLARGIEELFRREYFFAHLALANYSKTVRELNLPGYMNLRDALAHLRRALDEKLEPGYRAEQVICAREHLRRAGMEAYQELCERQYRETCIAYNYYRTHYLPQEIRLQELEGEGILDHVEIILQLKDARGFLKGFRKGKDGGSWQDATVELVQAQERLHKIYLQIKQAADRLSGAS